MRAVATLSEEWTTEDHKEEDGSDEMTAGPATATRTTDFPLTDHIMMIMMMLSSLPVDTCHPERMRQQQGIMEMRMVSISHSQDRQRD